MSMKQTVQKQRQARIDRAADARARALETPSEGWIALVRSALGLSAAQLARTMGQTRANISKTERAELSEGASIRTLKAAAEAMGCKFVYGIVPREGGIADLIEAQARKKAAAVVENASTHMALEKQALTKKQQNKEIERITQELMRDMPSDLWVSE